MTYTGARLSALWQINDNWDALLQQNYQNMEADGYFSAYPTSTNGQALGTLSDHRLRARVQQGRLRKHGLDAKRQESRTC